MGAGAASPIIAHSTAPYAQGSTALASTVDFRSSRWLSDRKVVNNNGEEIANVSDLILDRGSGRIEYVVIKTGTTFGLGGRAVAIPYGSFAWEMGAKDRFVLAATVEQLKQFPEYTPESWNALKESAKDEKNSLQKRMAADAASPSDPYAGNLDMSKKARVEGDITSVERVRTSTAGEQVVITVAPAAGGPAKRIALGPSWFVNATSAAPMRGDKVVVETLALPRDPDQTLVGTDFRMGDRRLVLRDSKGSPVWALKSVESGGQTYSTPYSRYLLLSALPGMKINSRGDECGKVSDVILDRNSGEVGFVSIDPNQNFLGIGDTKRLLPWSVTMVTLDGSMRIDASKEMVLASPETPSDLSLLNSGTHAERVYKAYGVPAPRFAAVKPVAVVMPEGTGPWSARGCVAGSVDHGSARTMEGRVTDVTEVKFTDGTPSARALKIKVAGDETGESVVLLGPVMYMENQKSICSTGDAVKVEACRTTINGQQYWIARTVECKDNRVVLMDGSKAPAWAQP